MMGLLAAGLDPWLLIIYGTIGNVAGGMFNYTVGHMGKLEWIEKYLHVSQESLDKATRFMGGRGAWMGFADMPKTFTNVLYQNEEVDCLIDDKMQELF